MASAARRTTPLSVAGLLGLALLAPTTSATAVGETCRGEAATIVGTPGQPLTGTEGRDVIATNGAYLVDALGGDDLVCVTGATTGGPGLFNVVEVDAGAGNDLVDGSVTPGWSVRSQLGTGADQFIGGAGNDSVQGGFADPAQGFQHADSEADVMIGGGGDDYFTSGQSPADNADVVDGGEGDDYLTVLGTRTGGGVVVGGGGDDYLSATLRPGANVLDGPAGRLTGPSGTPLEWSGIESFSLSPQTRGGKADLEVIGTPGDDLVEVYSTGRLTASMGAGVDQLYVLRAPEAGSDLDGGPGRDELTTGTQERLLSWDMQSGKLRVGAASAYPARRFEDAHLMARNVTLRGTQAANDLRVLGCKVTAEGRGGKDELSRTFDSWFETYEFACTERYTLRGGQGADTLRGGRGPDRLFGGRGNDVMQGGNKLDVLIGGPGRDRADGGMGRDRCSAERERRCER